MSSIFWDNLILLPAVEAEIKTVAETEEEKHELWQIVDEIIHHRMLELILDVLNEEHHHEFLERFHQAPHDVIHFQYLDERTDKNIKELFIEKIKEFEAEILRDIRA